MNQLGFRLSQRAIMVAATLQLCLTPCWSQEATVNIGNRSISIKPESLEEELVAGKFVMSQLLGSAKLLPNEDIQKYVNLVGKHVANQTDRKELKWCFGVIDSKAINAFAAPGGFILITSSLLELLESEDELAAVLAHEIAHVVKKHHYRVIRKQQMLEFGMNAVEIENAGQANKLSSMVAQVIARGLDKNAEFEADRDGMVYASRAGYDSSALIRIMEKLAAQNKGDESTQLVLSTHPTPSERANALSVAANAEIENAASKSKASSRLLINLKK